MFSRFGFSQATYEWTVETDQFVIGDGTALFRAFYDQAVTFSEPVVVVGRWNPSTELMSWRNGRLGTPLTVSVPSAINTSNTTTRLGAPSSGTGSGTPWFAMTFPTVHSNATVKANIDKLANAFNVPDVDTSGII